MLKTILGVLKRIHTFFCETNLIGTSSHPGRRTSRRCAPFSTMRRICERRCTGWMARRTQSERPLEALRGSRDAIFRVTDGNRYLRRYGLLRQFRIHKGGLLQSTCCRRDTTGLGRGPGRGESGEARGAAPGAALKAGAAGQRRWDPLKRSMSSRNVSIEAKVAMIIREIATRDHRCKSRFLQSFESS